MTDLNKAPAVGVTDALRAFVAIPPLQYGAVGTRDVDVGCWQRAHAAAVAALAGAAQGAEPSALRGALEEIAAMEYDKWSNGARAGEIARNALAMQSQSIPVTGATVADRLDALADREQAGSQAASDLYAAATIWRKHLKAGVAQGAEPPDHFPPREAFIWNLGFRAGAETATLDVVQAAADASSVGHLSALLDIQTALLGRAMAVMKAVEGAASPANEGSGDFTATIPYGAWAEFVDARAGLLYAVAQSPIGASPQPTAPEKKE